MAAVVLAPTQLAVAAADHPIYGARPALRGRFHQLGVLVSLPAAAVLVGREASSTGRPAAIGYAVTCVLLYLTSACYHRLAQSVMARFWMRRLDHSMILVHLGGATMPIALLGVGGLTGHVMLAASWTGVLIGVGLKMTGLTALNDPCPWLFPILGWLPLIGLPALAQQSMVDAGLLLAAVSVYAAGGWCFAKRRPDPVPTVFGFHEVFHVCTLVGGAFQFVLTARLVG